MRIISKIKKNYPDIKDLLKNNDSNNLDNIISTTFNGSNLYILSNDLLYYNFETKEINLLSGNIILNNPTKIVNNLNNLGDFGSNFKNADI